MLSKFFVDVKYEFVNAISTPPHRFYNHLSYMATKNKHFLYICNMAGNPIDYLPYKIIRTLSYYSNSMVPGGLLVRSYSTLLTPFTSLIILFMTLNKTSYGISAHSAVMKSLVFTALRATA